MKHYHLFTLIIVFTSSTAINGLHCYRCANCSDSLAGLKPQQCVRYGFIYWLALCASGSRKALEIKLLDQGTNACFKSVDMLGNVNRGCYSRSKCMRRAQGENSCADAEDMAQRRVQWLPGTRTMCCCTEDSCNAAHDWRQASFDVICRTLFVSFAVYTILSH